jgi:hypothetical protein
MIKTKKYSGDSVPHCWGASGFIVRSETPRGSLAAGGTMRGLWHDHFDIRTDPLVRCGEALTRAPPNGGARTTA